MCGIAGLMRIDGGPPDEAAVARMLATLVHRGPDGDGTLRRGPLVLGHRRLSIIDVAGSPQPMTSASGRIHVSFNGEIFNYRELRASWLPTATRFARSGDTEVLLALFSATAPRPWRSCAASSPTRSTTRPRDELWLFRDRLGIVPLYFRIERRDASRSPPR